MVVGRRRGGPGTRGMYIVDWKKVGPKMVGGLMVEDCAAAATAVRTCNR
jgi:hypothetical protein